MADRVRLTIFSNVIDQQFFGSAGQVTAFTHETARRVLVEAMNRVGRLYSGQHTRRIRSLRFSGKVEPAPTGPPDWTVVFTHPAAEVHHNGAKSHIIGTGTDSNGTRMHNPFRATRDGEPFFRIGSVRHPGHKPNPYLTGAARELKLRVSQRPGGFSQRGFARIPRGFK